MFLVPKQPLLILPTHLLLSILLLYSFAFSYSRDCSRQDHSALLAFATNISTSPSCPLNWSSLTNCCTQWEGIECNINGRVTHLQLPSRGLKGVITSSINNLAMLKVMDLSSNTIHGSIPRGIGKLLHLERLHLQDNNLCGPIPSSLMNCTRLVDIILRDNNLNGDISKLDLSKLFQLQRLDLRTNSLNGTLPETIYSRKTLIALGASLNFITGQISPKIVELQSLSFFSLSQNSFTNITSALRLLARCKNLTSLFLSFNFYRESLPAHKDFIGSSEFQRLQFFALHNCEFEPGPIPSWLSSLKNLRVLGLKGNRMVGRVPNWLGSLPKLFTLELNNNTLFGKLPLTLFELHALVSPHTQEDLNFSQFELPVFMSSKTKNLYIRYKSDYYHGLGLSYNSFGGVIPKEIGNLRDLQMLFLNNNNFSGRIPTRISKLENLEILNLSTNNLEGEIPTSLVSLRFLSQFDVSHNDLKGPIPTGGQFDTFKESSFEGNPRLCGELLIHPCSTSPMTRQGIDGSGSRDKRKPFLNGLFVGFASGFSGILICVASYFWFNYCRRCQPSS